MEHDPDNQSGQLRSAGITIFGADVDDRSGWSVSRAGDINGDGFADLIIGAMFADASGNAKPNAGESYVIFGKANWSTTPTIDLASLGSAGITILGADVEDRSGQSVRNAGDVNGDGFDDLVIGAYRADALGNLKWDAGESYLIYYEQVLCSMTPATGCSDSLRCLQQFINWVKKSISKSHRQYASNERTCGQYQPECSSSPLLLDCSCKSSNDKKTKKCAKDAARHSISESDTHAYRNMLAERSWLAIELRKITSTRTHW